jgi:hypothetical protein
VEGFAELKQELVSALTYSLQLAPGDTDPGCYLNTDGTGFLPPVRDRPEPVLQLWRAVADGVTEPAAVAHFADLLWSRRDGQAHLHAARAAQAYLTLAGTGATSVPRVEFLVRAWTIARDVRDPALGQQARAALALLAEEVITNDPGQRPSVLLPALATLAKGPIRRRKEPPALDPIDVDLLLSRAAAACLRGSDASRIARYRRGRVQDPTALSLIARKEVDAYFRDAEAAPNPAARMMRLRAAAQIARARGLRDLERTAATGMQNILPADLGMITVSASSTLPTHIVEGYLRDFTRPARWQEALGAFLSSECPTGEVTGLRQLAAQTNSPLSNILRPHRFSAGQPRISAQTPQEIERHAMSFAATMRAETMGRLLAEGLGRLAARYGIPGEDELVEYLTDCGARDVPWPAASPRPSGICGTVTPSRASTSQRPSSRPLSGAFSSNSMRASSTPKR